MPVLLDSNYYLFRMILTMYKHYFLVQRMNMLVLPTEPGGVICGLRTKSEFDPGSYHWDLLCRIWHLDMIFSKYFSLLPSDSFHHCSVLFFIFIQLLFQE